MFCVAVLEVKVRVLVCLRSNGGGAIETDGGGRALVVGGSQTRAEQHPSFPNFCEELPQFLLVWIGTRGYIYTKLTETAKS